MHFSFSCACHPIGTELAAVPFRGGKNRFPANLTPILNRGPHRTCKEPKSSLQDGPPCAPALGTRVESEWVHGTRIRSAYQIFEEHSQFPPTNVCDAIQADTAKKIHLLTGASHGIRETNIRVRDERIIQVPECVGERELLVSFRLMLPAKHITHLLSFCLCAKL